MKVLITGGAGFIGSNIAEFYAWKGDEVVCLDDYSRDGYKYRVNNIKKMDPPIPVRFHLCDVRSFENVSYEIATFQPDVVFHCAGQTAAITSIDIPYKDFMINTVGSINVLESIRNSKCDPVIILCSTNKVFGTLPTAQPTPEWVRADTCPKTPYGISKTCADLYFQEYAKVYNMKTGIFRMSCIYGYGQFGMEEQGWVAHFIQSALQDKKIIIYGDGKQTRDLLWITDLVNAFDKFIPKADIWKGNIFCMGGGEHFIMSLNDVINYLGEMLDKELEVEYKDVRPHDQKYYISDITKATKVLNWQPSIKPHTGIRILTKWYQQNRYF